MIERGLAALELELRQLRGVIGVGLERSGGALLVHLLLSPGAARDEVARGAREVTRGHLDEPVTFEIEQAKKEAHPQKPGLERVRLVAVRSLEGEVEVHLAHKGARTVGRGDPSGADGAVAAAIDAIEGLGVQVPFKPATVATVTQGLDYVVVVVLSPRGPAPHAVHRMGVARGATVEESACKATLHALNRYLEGRGASEPLQEAPAG